MNFISRLYISLMTSPSLNPALTVLHLHAIVEEEVEEEEEEHLKLVL